MIGSQALTTAALLVFTGIGIWFDWSLWFTVPPFVLVLLRAVADA